jgi:hypothetical protein
MRIAPRLHSISFHRVSILVNFACAKYHSWLHTDDSQWSDFIDTLQSAGIARVAFIRHGQTSPPPAGGSDFDRILTDTGRAQVHSAGSSYGVRLQPYFMPIVVSPAPRTIETAEIFFNAVHGNNDTLIEYVTPRPLYDGVMQPDGSKLFRKIGYAPLRKYVDNDDNDDRIVARDVLGTYAHTVANVLLDAVKGSNTCAENANSTLCFVGHAIYLPSAALHVAILAGCDTASQDVILSTNTREAEGYLIDLTEKEATYLTRH